MADPNDIARLEKGKTQWNSWANDLLEIKTDANDPAWKSGASVDFSGHKFDGEAKFDDFIFPCDANFEGTNFEGSALFRNAVFVGKVSFARSRFYTVGSFNNAQFRNKANFSEVRANQKLIFDSSILSDADFYAAKLARASFQNANLNSANLLAATLDRDTDLTHASVDGCKIDRYGLECLKDYGGLSVGALMKMKIRDDVAELRATYSGFWQWVHIAALIGFTFPYLWFVISQWSNAAFLSGTTDEFMPLWQAIARFIFNGGVGWEYGWQFHYSFLLFVGSLLYNLLRFSLLMKTKQLELAQVTRGVPTIFYMNEAKVLFGSCTWELLYNFSKYLFVVYLVIVLVNLMHFLTMKIPIPA